MSRESRREFTLVEVLVVMAIISILMSLLLPALKKSLEAAKCVTCTNNEKQIYCGLSIYCGDHGDYLPPTGLYLQWPAYAGGGRMWCDQLAELNYVPPCGGVLFTASGNTLIRYIEGNSPYTKKHDVPQPFGCPNRTLADGFRKEFGSAAQSWLYSPNSMWSWGFSPTGTESGRAWRLSSCRQGYILFTEGGNRGEGINLNDAGGSAYKKELLNHDNGANYAFVDGHVKYSKSYNYLCYVTWSYYTIEPWHYYP